MLRWCMQGVAPFKLTISQMLQLAKCGWELFHATVSITDQHLQRRQVDERSRQCRQGWAFDVEDRDAVTKRSVAFTPWFADKFVQPLGHDLHSLTADNEDSGCVSQLFDEVPTMPFQITIGIEIHLHLHKELSRSTLLTAILHFNQAQSELSL